MNGGDIAATAPNGQAAAPRVLGSFCDLRELQVLMRARAEELQISRETIDELAGFASGYASKMLAPMPLKKMGELSIRLLIGALAVKLIVVDDPERRARMAERYTPRNPKYAAHAGVVNVIFSKHHLRTIGKRGGANSRRYMTREEATRLAMKAGRNSRKRVSSKRARELAQAAGHLGAAARWGDIKSAVRNPGPDVNGHGPGRPPKGTPSGASRCGEIMHGPRPALASPRRGE